MNGPFDSGSRVCGPRKIPLTNGRLFARIDVSHSDIELGGELLLFAHLSLLPPIL